GPDSERDRLAVGAVRIRAVVGEPDVPPLPSSVTGTRLRSAAAEPARLPAGADHLRESGTAQRGGDRRRAAESAERIRRHAGCRQPGFTVRRVAHLAGAPPGWI